jgi:NADH-ubiquinone oxidoreductase chain 2
LALSISSIESTQAFIFYLIQYSISNLNAFIILITIGFSLYYFINEESTSSTSTHAGFGARTEYKELLDKNNSPIQLVNQLRGYFYINPLLALSLAITIFSFAGIPPLVGFFAKQMVLSAALDNGFFFLSLVAILTSVIGAVYYLNVIKEIFFFLPQYKLNPLLNNFNLNNNIYTASFSSDTNSKENNFIKSITLKYNNVVMASSISITISTITLVVLLFIFMNKE